MDFLRSKSGSRPTMRRNPELVWSWSWFSFSQLVLGVFFGFFQVKKARGPILSKVLLATFVSERRVTIRHSFSFEQWKHKALQLYAVMLASWLVCVVVWCPWATQWTRNVSTRPGGMGVDSNTSFCCCTLSNCWSKITGVYRDQKVLTNLAWNAFCLQQGSLNYLEGIKQCKCTYGNFEGFPL